MCSTTKAAPNISAAKATGRVAEPLKHTAQEVDRAKLILALLSHHGPPLGVVRPLNVSDVDK